MVIKNSDAKTSTIQSEERTIALECRNIVKYYGHVQALDSVNLKLYKGEMLGLVGDNGAGKSTLVKILRGVIKPTSGEVLIEDELKEFRSPRDAVQQGIQCVYQESAIVEQLSVAENFFLGQEPIKNNENALIKRVDSKKMRSDSRQFLSKMGFDLDVRDEIKNFSGGQRQAVSILRALYFNPKILLLDEPTTALSEKAKVRLFEFLQETKQVCPMILITQTILGMISSKSFM
jgi:ABC-type sugar transport system ATPase subunit